MDQNWLAASWQALIARGAIAVVFGIVAMAWPLETALAVVLLWGIWALVDGISSLVQAFSGSRGGWSRVALAAMGVIALVAAAFALFQPIKAGVALAWILGLWLIARGVLELVLAVIGTPPAPRWALFLSAAVDFLLGVLFVSNPGRSALGLTVLLGLLALFWGVMCIVVGLLARKQAKAMSPATGSA